MSEVMAVAEVRSEEAAVATAELEAAAAMVDAEAEAEVEAAAEVTAAVTAIIQEAELYGHMMTVAEAVERAWLEEQASIGDYGDRGCVSDLL